MSRLVSPTILATSLAALLAVITGCAVAPAAGQTASGGSGSGPVLNLGDQQQYLSRS
jgi:hypothetical protein